MVVMTTVSHYATELVALTDRRALPCGSGTFVLVDGAPYILTAGHVWNEGLAGATHVGISVGSDGRAREVAKEALSPAFVSQGASAAFGPDLAFLGLSPHDYQTIKPIKSFWNLSLHRKAAMRQAPPPRAGMIVLVGCAAEKSRVEGRVIHLDRCAYFRGGIDRTRRRGHFDYLELRADLQRPKIPRTFGGVSGGGLWRAIPASDSKGRLSWDGNLAFEGVAFYQTPVRGHYRRIRCHGRRSVYGWALRQLRARLARRATAVPASVSGGQVNG